MGGGGANSLDSPKIDNNTDFESDKNDVDVSDNKEETTWTTPTYKTYDDYFTDYNISKETIFEEDLTGSGSEEDPYVLNSTRGFFYLLTNRMLINSKYIELNCDIILNDETFDENGTPSGGDGVVYSWKDQGAYTFSFTTIYGNGHKIIGCYYNNGETNFMSIFGSGGGNVIKDLNVENLYINAGYGAVGLIFGATLIENCIVKGYLIGTGANAGIAFSPDLIKNCINYVKVISSEGFVSGICFGGTQVINCVNYAPLQGGCVAGISESASYIKNCINYGDLYSNSSYQRISGIATAAGEILSCTNYGAIRTEGAGLKGGISYSAKNQARKNIINCTNFGYIERDGTCGEILGNTWGDITINIQNCKGYSVAGCAIIGQTGNGTQQINLKNIELFADIDNASGVTVVCAYAVNRNVCWYLENISVKVKNQDALRLFSTVYAKKIVLNGIVLHHTSIKNVAPENYIFENYNNDVILVVEEGVVIENKQTSEKYYFGNKFDSFYINWKSGNIKLKSLNQGSYFQGQLTEEVLINKGFEKKEI